MVKYGALGKAHIIMARETAERRHDEEVKIAPATTAEQLLRLPLRSESGLSMRRAPLTLASRQTTRGTEYAALMDYEMTGNFFTFLSNIFPQKGRGGQDIASFWRFMGSSYPEAISIIEQHDDLRTAWQEFRGHKNVFAEAMNPLHGGFIPLGSVFSESEAQSEKERTGRDFITFDYHKRLLGGSKGVGYVKAIEGYTFMTRDQAQDLPIHNNRDTHIVDSGVYRGSGRFSIGIHYPDSPMSKTVAFFQVTPETIQKKGDYLLPLLHWENTGAQRNWLFQVPQQGLEEGCGTQRLSEFTHADTLLGLLTLAFFSKQITESWPRDWQLRGIDRRAFGAALLPVLAIKERNSLLQSDFIAAAEKHALKAA